MFMSINHQNTEQGTLIKFTGTGQVNDAICQYQRPAFNTVQCMSFEPKQSWFILFKIVLEKLAICIENSKSSLYFNDVIIILFNNNYHHSQSLSNTSG